MRYSKDNFTFFLRPVVLGKVEFMGKIKYTKLLTMLEKQGLTTYKIRKDKIISESTLQNIRQEKRITTDSIASLCEALNCQSGDILEYVPDENLPTKGP